MRFDEYLAVIILAKTIDFHVTDMSFLEFVWIIPKVHYDVYIFFKNMIKPIGLVFFLAKKETSKTSCWVY